MVIHKLIKVSRNQSLYIPVPYVENQKDLNIILGSNLSSEAELFEQTTIANLNPSDYILWVHISVSFITFPIAIFMMRRFSANLSFVKTNIEISKTLMIENIALELCKNVQEIQRYFQVMYINIK